MPMKVRTCLFVCILSACVALLGAFPASASTVPQLVSYDGTLTNAAGQPVTDGQYAVVFSIYSVQTGGSPLWTETWSGANSITTANGDFSVLLGSRTAIPASFFQTNSTTYLGVKVGTDAEMLPRQRISSVAYAMASYDGIPTGGIIMWSGSIATIPAGWGLCDGVQKTAPDGSLVTPPDLRNRFVVAAGLTYAPASSGGSATINIAHTHTVNSHTHPFSGMTNGDSDHNRSTSPNTGSVAEADHKHTFAGTTAGGTAATASGLSATQSILPPYYALAYIMKL